MLEAVDATGRTDCFADISIIGSTGDGPQIWKSPGPLQSETYAGETYFVLDIDSVILHRADYVVTLRRANGEIIDNYLFRVSD